MSHRGEQRFTLTNSTYQTTIHLLSSSLLSLPPLTSFFSEYQLNIFLSDLIFLLLSRPRLFSACALPLSSFLLPCLHSSHYSHCSILCFFLSFSFLFDCFSIFLSSFSLFLPPFLPPYYIYFFHFFSNIHYFIHFLLTLFILLFIPLQYSLPFMFASSLHFNSLILILPVSLNPDLFLLPPFIFSCNSASSVFPFAPLHLLLPFSPSVQHVNPSRHEQRGNG